MTVVFIGVGSNIGDRKVNFREAAERMAAAEGIEINKFSGAYRTKPVGGPPQEDYLNGVLEVRTDLSAEELLEALKRIEKQMGRKPACTDAPRIIDLDILLYGDKIIKTEKLTVPHPRMHERLFVLEGLQRIAPQVVHPELGKTAEELYRELKRAS